MKKIIFALIFPFVGLWAQEFTYDTSYANNGAFCSNGVQNNSILGIVPLENSKVITISNVDVTQFDDKGQFVSTFGTKFGKANLPESFGLNPNIRIRGFYIKNNDLYLCGSDYKLASKNIFVSKMSLDTGVIDTTFGVNGLVTKDLGEDEELNAIVVTDTGEIIAIGHKGKLNSIESYGRNGKKIVNFDNSKLLKIKLLPNGSFNTTFGTNGVQEEFLFPSLNHPISIINAADGGYYQLIWGQLADSTISWAIQKWDASGNLDTTFGDGGTYFNSSPKYIIANSFVEFNKNIYINCYTESFSSGYFLLSKTNGVLKLALSGNSIEGVADLGSDSVYELKMIDDNSFIGIKREVIIGKDLLHNLEYYASQKYWIQSFRFPEATLITDYNTQDFLFKQAPLKIVSAGNLVTLCTSKYDSNGSLTLFGIITFMDSSTSDYRLWSVRLGLTLGIEDFTNKGPVGVVITPNPAQHTVQISLNNQAIPQRLTLYGIQGNEISQCYNTNQLSLEGLAKGMYFVKIQTEKGTYFEKVIKE